MSCDAWVVFGRINRGVRATGTSPTRKVASSIGVVWDAVCVKPEPKATPCKGGAKRRPASLCDVGCAVRPKRASAMRATRTQSGQGVCCKTTRHPRKAAQVAPQESRAAGVQSRPEGHPLAAFATAWFQIARKSQQPGAATLGSTGRICSPPQAGSGRPATAAGWRTGRNARLSAVQALRGAGVCVASCVPSLKAAHAKGYLYSEPSPCFAKCRPSPTDPQRFRTRRLGGQQQREHMPKRALPEAPTLPARRPGASGCEARRGRRNRRRPRCP